MVAVMLKGLKNEMYNGKRGERGPFDARSGRWAVTVDSKTIHVLPERIEVITQKQLCEEAMAEAEQWARERGDWALLDEFSQADQEVIAAKHRG